MSIGSVGGNSGLPSQAQQIQSDAASGDFSMPGAGENDSGYYLKLMEEMQAEQRAFQAFTQVLSSRHEAAMAAIRNVKG
jgi:hypothetical protein